MKHIPITQLQPAPNVESVYLLQQVEWKNKRNGDPFVSVVFADATGTVPGVLWDNFTALINRQVVAEDFVLVTGEVSLYNNSPQFIVRKLVKVPDEQVDFRKFLAHTPKDLGELEAELDERIASIASPDCRRLLEYFLGRESGRIRKDFCAAPAAVRVHQAYIGGLLEHTLAVLRNALVIADQYKPYDRDLLITGGLLHDAGKIREYAWNRIIRYTDEGRLVGHISICVGWLSLAFRDLAPFDERLAWNLVHLVLSHHGKREWGSPVLPKTREALFLHYADFTDAYLATYCLETDRAREQGELWTSFNKLFDTYLYAGPTRSGETIPPNTIPPMEPEDPRWFGSGGDSVDDPGK
jgi:3'-5' exoribonuclease